MNLCDRLGYEVVLLGEVRPPSSGPRSFLLSPDRSSDSKVRGLMRTPMNDTPALLGSQRVNRFLLVLMCIDIDVWHGHGVSASTFNLGCLVALSLESTVKT